MIDGLATIIQFLKTKSVELGTDQIASRHRFAETGGWAAESAGIVVRRDGGPVDLYSALQIVRCEVRIYGGDSVEAGSIYGELVAVTRAASRELVSLPAAGVDALLQYFLPVSGPSFLTDADLGREFILVFVNGMVSETPVS